jgi:aryl-alcohol dehydrogenase-like predicted oxidoreductase
MNYRSFGSTGLKVSEIGLGCSGIGGSVFYKDDRESARVLNRAFELGINFYDTADTYTNGRSEKLIGSAFKDRRSQIIIASKVGMLPSSLYRLGKTLLPVLRPIRRVIEPWKSTLKKVSKHRQEFSSLHVKKSIEQSLRSLQTDYLDLYQLHSPPSWVIEQGEVFETLDLLKHQGKIRFYGISAKTISDAILCLKYPNISSLQVVFNLLEQEAVRELLPLAQRKGIAIAVRVLLARGLLTNKMTVQTGPTINRNQLQIARAKVEELSFLANKKRALSQAALQFVLCHSQVSVVIRGTSKVKHLEDNIKALEAPTLTKEEIEKIAWLHQKSSYNKGRIEV